MTLLQRAISCLGARPRGLRHTLNPRSLTLRDIHQLHPVAITHGCDLLQDMNVRVACEQCNFWDPGALSQNIAQTVFVLNSRRASGCRASIVEFEFLRAGRRRATFNLGLGLFTLRWGLMRADLESGLVTRIEPCWVVGLKIGRRGTRDVPQHCSGVQHGKNLVILKVGDGFLYCGQKRWLTALSP